MVLVVLVPPPRPPEILTDAPFSSEPSVWLWMLLPSPTYSSSRSPTRVLAVGGPRSSSASAQTTSSASAGRAQAAKSEPASTASLNSSAANSSN